MDGTLASAARRSMKVSSGAPRSGRAMALGSPVASKAALTWETSSESARTEPSPASTAQSNTSAFRPVHLADRTGRGLRREAAETQRPRHLEPGPDDRIVDHHHRHGRARDDVEIVRRAAFSRLQFQVDAGIGLGQPPHFRVRYADQHDGLGMLDEPDSGEHRIG